MTREQKFHRNSLLSIATFETLGGAFFLIMGADAMPEGLPMSWASMAHPSILLFLSGMLFLTVGQLTLCMAE